MENKSKNTSNNFLYPILNNLKIKAKKLLPPGAGKNFSKVKFQYKCWKISQKPAEFFPAPYPSQTVKCSQKRSKFVSGGRSSLTWFEIFRRKFRNLSVVNKFHQEYSQVISDEAIKNQNCISLKLIFQILFRQRNCKLIASQHQINYRKSISNVLLS